jgi:3',5'-nucleoside bisphosphate phosphatase
MDKYIDLHTHSTASDGSLRPRELVRYAQEKGICAIALTDHDTVDGLSDAMDEAEKIGIEVIPGVEIGVDFAPEMHILGYFSKNDYVKIREVLINLRKSRDERNPKIIGKLRELGFDISMQEVEDEAKGLVVGRPHIAKVLMDKGYVDTVSEAFDKYLGSGKPAHFKKDKLTPGQGIQEITKAGGIAVLAHPIYLGKNNPQLDELLETLVTYGLKGIEAHYVTNTRDDTGNLLRLALKHRLLVTGGSDFHGSFKPDVEIGTGHGNLQIPYELLEKLKGALRK